MRSMCECACVCVCLCVCLCVCVYTTAGDQTRDALNNNKTLFSLFSLSLFFNLALLRPRSPASFESSRAQTPPALSLKVRAQRKTPRERKKETRQAKENVLGTYCCSPST